MSLIVDTAGSGARGLQDPPVYRASSTELRSAERFTQLLERAPVGWAVHRIVLDENGVPVDYVFLDVNPAFEAFTGLAAAEILGRRVTEVIPEIESASPGLIRIYGTVALSGEDAQITLHFEPFDRWYSVTVFQSQEEHFVTIFTDITLQKKTELALAEREAQFRAVVEDQTEFIVRWLPDGTCTFVNGSYCRLFGGTPKDHLGTPFPDQFDNGERDALKASLLSITPQDPVVVRDLPVRAWGDRTIWCQLTTRGLFDAQGQLEEFQTVGQEVTGRRQAQEELKASEERFRTLFEFAPDAYYLNDAQGRFLDGNRAAEELIGYPRSEIVGKSFMKVGLLAPRDIPKAARLLAKNALGHPTGPDEFDLRRRDGSVASVEIRTYPLTIQGERVVLGLARDLTGRRAAERALRKSEEEFRELVENATYGILRLDTNGTFQLVNPALTQMLGVDSPDRLLGVRIHDAGLKDPEEAATLLDRLSATGRVDGYEMEWMGPGGETVVLRVSGRPVRNHTGEIESFELMAEDITEQRSLQAQLRQAQKMEEIGQLTGGIAHDFNNLLSVILLHTELLQDRLVSADPVVRSAVMGIGEASERAASMTRKLLGFSRRATLQPIPTDLARVAEGLLSMLSRILPETIRIDLRVQDGARLVSADPGAIEQMILNLATNARDAMPDGGELTVSVTDAALPADFWETRPWAKPGEYVGIAVRDNGMGMDEDTRLRIFEPFFTTKSTAEGTGLGMSMVYGLCKQHGGFVEVESTQGEGTTVSLFFPALASPGREEPCKEELRTVLGGSETILFVEDEEMLRKVGASILEQHGYRVLCAGDGVEALKMIRDGEESVDLILTDLVMPGMGGAELVKTLKDSGECPLAMYVSGYPGLNVDPGRDLDDSIPFLQKPWKMSQLLQRVRDVLDGVP